MEAFRRLFEAALRGGKRGWGANDPVGYDPESVAAHRQLAARYPILRPIQAFNEGVGYPVTAAADAIVRGGNAALHGGAALAGQAYNEATGESGMGRRLERDILGLAHMAGAGAGRLGGVAANGSAQRAITLGKRHHVPTQLERLIERGGKPVKVGQLSEEQLEAIRKVVPERAAELFQAADGSVYATEGLLNSLRMERPKHAERLIRGMPDHLEQGQIRGNYNPDQLNRPVIIKPSPEGKKKSDLMVLDAVDTPGEIGVPSIFTSRDNIVNRGKRP